jgi:hypothetical protein
VKKLLTLTALVAGVALFAGWMNKPVEEDVTVDETPAVEEVVTEEVAPEVTTEEVTPEATS